MLNSSFYFELCLLDLDTVNDVKHPASAHHWPRGAIIKNMPQGETPELSENEQLERLIQNPLLSSQILDKRQPEFREEVRKDEDDGEEEEEEEIDYFELLEGQIPNSHLF